MKYRILYCLLFIPLSLIQLIWFGALSLFIIPIMYLISGVYWIYNFIINGNDCKYYEEFGMNITEKIIFAPSIFIQNLYDKGIKK